DGCERRWSSGSPCSAWRPHACRPADLPLMTERIENPAQPPAMLIGHLRCRRGTGAYRLREHRVGIIDYQQDPARRTPNRLRAEPRPLRPARRNPECGVSNRELRDDVISLPHTVKDPGTEGRLVERDSRISVVDPQFRLDTRHAGRGYPPSAALCIGDRFLIRSPPRRSLRASSQVTMPAVLSGSGRLNPRSTTSSGTLRARWRNAYRA